MPMPLVVAHRGASADAPENTLAAIRTAAAHGADAVEVDVQRTRDGVPVLMHDETLVRTTDVRTRFPDRAPWRVADLDHAELAELDAGSWKSPRFAGERVPTLVEVVREVHTLGLDLLLEVKLPQHHPGLVLDVLDALRAVPGYLGAAVAGGGLVVQSFDVPSVRLLKAVEPGIPVGVLGAPWRERLPALSGWADQVNPWHLTADEDYVRTVHEAGLDCLVWTVDRGLAIRRAAGLGVDGIITNRPAAVRPAIAGVVRRRLAASG